jgi:hypothetical protein
MKRLNRSNKDGKRAKVKTVFQSNNATPGTFSFEIFSMNTDGSGLTQITSNTVYDGFDLWWWNYGSTSVEQQANARAAYRTPTNHPGASQMTA